MLANSIDLTFITPNVVTLTPNRRLAAFLLTYYQQQNIDSGRTVWEQPAIYPVTTWIEQSWQDFFRMKINSAKRLLTTIEQQLIWEQIIINSKEGEELFEISSTASKAIDAWNMLLQYDLLADFLASDTEQYADCAVFKSWAKTYHARCEQEGWIDCNAMLNLLINGISIKTIPLPEACYLIEHQELPPQHERFFAALAKLGVAIIHKQLNIQECNDIAVISLSSKEEEYRLAANWAKQSWQNNAAIRIGIVVLDLAENREHIASIFAEYFTEQVYNIAAPRAIAHYSLLDTALLILQLSSNIKARITINDLNKLLRTPFVAHAETEILRRAMLATMLQDSKEMEFEYSYLQNYFSSLPAENLGKCDGFTDIFLQWLQYLDTTQGQHTSEYWVVQINNILKIWGWPGERIIDENERQLLVCWELLLQSYLQAGFVLKKHSFAQAYKTLQKLALITPFLPETGTVPIHILGSLEAAGLPFDKLWVMGMYSSAWPMAPAPNPFIPLNLQRQYNLPRSSPTRELTVAKNLTNTFARGGYVQVVYSYPKAIDDVPTTASRLIANFKTITIKDLLMHSYNASPYLSGNNTQLEESIDETGSALTCADVAFGGSKALTLQAKCPFWAYAEIRLGALPMTRYSIGLTPAERGELLHNVLAKFWRHVKSHDYLTQNSGQNINNLIQNYLTEHLQLLCKKRPCTLTANYLSLEIERMSSLINKWLLYEKQRTPFIVYKIEQQRLLRIGPLKLKIRVDRIDQLTTGEIIIIDYKTGKAQIKEWFTERIQEPQLPLYCLASEVAADGIAFAVIRPDLVLFKGVTAANGLLPNVASLQELTKNKHSDNWQQQCSYWQQQLTKLACEFQQGMAAAQPLLGATTCRFCSLQPLCRIYEKVAVEV